jgi:hypothetical protein
MIDTHVEREPGAAVRAPRVVLAEWRASLGRLERLDDQSAEWDREWRRGKDLAREYQQAFACYRDRAASRQVVRAVSPGDSFRAIVQPTVTVVSRWPRSAA